MKDASCSPLKASPNSLECSQGDISAGSITSCNGLALASPKHVQTMRHGLFHIHHLLEEDDGPGEGRRKDDDSFNFSAYHAKVSEFAAILKEDSPALNFNFSRETLLGTPSVDLEGRRPGNLLSYPITQGPVFLAHDNVADLNGVPTSCMSSKFFDNAALYRSMSAWPLRRASQDRKEVGSADAIGAIPLNFGRRRNRITYTLKPQCKENGQKMSGKTEASHVYVDLIDLLVRCAQAIGSNNRKAAMQILVKVKQHASPYGNAAQRLAYYFGEALDARLAGTGWHIYLGNMCQHRPSSKQIWQACCMYMSSCPFAKAFRFFINQTILDVAKGASRLHILEHQMTGFQYPSLFKELATRPGGPPQVRLVGVNTPHYSMMPDKIEELHDRLEKTGRQIAACAASCGVPFHFTAWAGITGDFPLQDSAHANRSRDEVLVELSAYPLRYINDDLLHPPMKRLGLLKTMCSLNPDVYIQGIVTGSYNTPFFSRRFQEALSHFESQYDMLDTFINRESADRIVFESQILGKAVLNIVACEEMDVVERVDKYKQWYAATKEAGFEQIPLKQGMKHKVDKILKGWHKDYIVTEDLDYLLMGWKGRTLHALTAWKGLNPSRP